MNRKFSQEGKKITWSKYQTIIYDRNDPFCLHVNEYGVDPVITNVPLQLKEDSQAFHSKKLKYLFPKSRPILKKKYDDLQQLLRYIPEERREFFKTLKYADDSEVTKDYGLATCQSSDEDDEKSDDDIEILDQKFNHFFFLFFFFFHFKRF